MSLAKHQRTFHPYDPNSSDDQAATTNVEYLWNKWFLNAIVYGDWDDDLDGKLHRRRRQEGRPHAEGSRRLPRASTTTPTPSSARAVGLRIPAPINAAVFQANMPTGRPKTDFGWDIYPQGLGTVLDEAATYGLPLVVTENGIADARDVNRVPLPARAPATSSGGPSSAATR